MLADLFKTFGKSSGEIGMLPPCPESLSSDTNFIRDCLVCKSSRDNEFKRFLGPVTPVEFGHFLCISE